MLAEYSEAHAERLLTVSTVLTGAVADPRIDDNTVANRYASNILADLVDDARSIGAEYPARCDADAGKTAQDEKIEMVESGRSHADADVGGSLELGNREIVSQLDLIQATVSGDRQAFHKKGTVIFKAFNQGILTSPIDVGAALRRR